MKLLKEEYKALQSRLAESEKKYSIAAAQTGNVTGDSFIVRLLKTVADLFDKELYRYVYKHLNFDCLVFS